MKIALYIDTDNPTDLETAERVIDVIKRGEDYKAWLKQLEKEQANTLPAADGVV